MIKALLLFWIITLATSHDLGDPTSENLSVIQAVNAEESKDINEQKKDDSVIKENEISTKTSDEILDGAFYKTKGLEKKKVPNVEPESPPNPEKVFDAFMWERF